MDTGNCSSVSEFIFLGFTGAPELRVFLFLLFFLIYGVTVLGNLGMIAVIQVSSHLHTPMYFFLSHLSLVDFCYSTIIVPKVLSNILSKDKAISFLGCMVQFYLFCTYAITEVFLLAVMAYDRFVAICNPLLYTVTMSRNLCMELVSGCYLCGMACSLIHLMTINIFLQPQSNGAMGMRNCSSVSEFILLGFTGAPELRVFLFLLFFLIYGVTVLGNLGMIAVIQVSSHLHTPMYFFLSHLSLVDFCYSTIIVPKMLTNTLKMDKAISFLGCMVQFYLFCTCVVTEVFLLAVMAYDRFVAICNPLLYTVTMSRNLCMELVSGCYLCGMACSLIHLCLALEIPSYRSNVIDHFFCDLPPLLSLACSDVTVNELLLYIVATVNEFTTIVIILTSYLLILITILRMHSAEGRRKAFSTCASHLTAI
ncbi:OR5L1 protein, partial [Crocuta crocuta]